MIIIDRQKRFYHLLENYFFCEKLITVGNADQQGKKYYKHADKSGSEIGKAEVVGRGISSDVKLSIYIIQPTR